MKTHSFLVVIGLLLLSCTRSGESIGRSAPSEQIKSGAHIDVSTTMNKLAFKLDLLNTALNSEQEVATYQKGEVVQHLKDIEALVTELKADTSGHYHPVFGTYVDAFLRDTKRARLAANRTPPNFYFAGRMAGSCQACHLPRTVSPPISLPEKEFR